MFFNTYWLCNYVENIDLNGFSESLKSLWQCNWSSNLRNDLIHEILTQTKFTDVDLSRYDVVTLLSLAISSLQAFVQDNFVGPLLADDSEFEKLLYHKLLSENDVNLKIKDYLISDGEEINTNVRHCELLAVAKLIFTYLNTERLECIDDCVDRFICQNWYLRYHIAHQNVIDENTNTLYKGVMSIANALDKSFEDSMVDVETQVLCMLEITQAFLRYKRILMAEERLRLIRLILNVSISVEGKLGLRTKYQQKALPQLLLKIETNDESCGKKFTLTSNETANLPTLLQLDDDVRLEKIKFLDDANNSTLTLPNIKQALIISIFEYIQTSQPKDKLANEELMPYLTTLLYQNNGPWPIRIAALLSNITLESTHKRTVERSLRQCEEVLKQITTSNNATNLQRLSFVYAAYIRPKWLIRSQLADLMVSLGLVKSALELYLQIEKWDSIILCYNILELKHKAAEIIQNELKKKETVELYCLLGDALDDKTWYEKAWSFSNERSGRAQRHLGCYYFSKKQYELAIPHLEKSLSINSLQENVWARLGYAALALEHWELAAKAYRQYTNIEPNGYESWNNLAKAYLNLGDKNRAHKILTEALRCNFDNWKVWENFLIVSIDTGNFEDVLNAHKRLGEIKDRYFDKEIIEITVKAICENAPDADGRPSERLRKKAQNLLAHLCVQYPRDGIVFELSAQLLENEPLLKAQKLQKAYRCHTQTQKPWTQTAETTLKVLTISNDLCAASLKALDELTERNKSMVLSQLSSARLSTQGCIKAASESEWKDQCTDILVDLNQYLENIRNSLVINL